MEVEAEFIPVSSCVVLLIFLKQNVKLKEAFIEHTWNLTTIPVCVFSQSFYCILLLYIKYYNI